MRRRHRPADIGRHIHRRDQSAILVGCRCRRRRAGGAAAQHPDLVPGLAQPGVTGWPGRRLCGPASRAEGGRVARGFQGERALIVAGRPCSARCAGCRLPASLGHGSACRWPWGRTRKTHGCLWAASPDTRRPRRRAPRASRARELGPPSTLQGMRNRAWRHQHEIVDNMPARCGLRPSSR